MSDKIVYSSEAGDLRKEAGEKPRAHKTASKAVPRDGIVRVRKESKGRGGKTVSVISGLPLTADNLERFASTLKHSCGAGGTVKDREILIQGDRVEAIIRFLQDEGYTVKRAGGA
jgi:translation initiation factor 1